LAHRVTDDVRRAVLCMVPPVSIDDLDPEDHPFVEDDMVTVIAVNQFVATLTQADQDLVHAVFWDGYQAAEVARARGVSRSAVSQRLTRIYGVGRAYFGDLKVAS
jgi:DNA-directed RNA polymerase specialized sigma24 family protein